MDFVLVIACNNIHFINQLERKIKGRLSLKKACMQTSEGPYLTKTKDEGTLWWKHSVQNYKLVILQYITTS